MLKLEIDEFLFEVKDEIICYEELGHEHADLWEKNFRFWLGNHKIKKENVKFDKQKNKTYYFIQDESDIFAIVDDYYTAYEQNTIHAYWKNFQ